MGSKTVLGSAILPGIGTLIGAGLDKSEREAKKARKEAEREQDRQQAEIDAQKREALAKRKGQIDALRSRMSGTGAGTRGFSREGIGGGRTSSTESLG